jgi:hypothetical protein
MGESRLRRWLPVFGLLAVLSHGMAAAEPALWAVDGRSNTVYLFGSVHLLPEGSFEIAGDLQRAYRNAALVCLEVDVGSLSPAEMTSITLARAVDPEGRGLFDLLGPSAGRVREAAAAADIELAPYAAFEPWFVGLTVSLLALQQHGYAADHGVEQVIQRAAQRDGKPGCGLETLDEQLGLLDNLPDTEQQDMLLQSLEEAARIDREMKQLFKAWQEGDVELLARQLDAEFADFPELADQLIYARNERWATQIAELLDRSDDVLVVVGALHLVGDRGLPAMLKRRGFRIERR